MYNIPRVSVPISSILTKIFPRTHGPEVLLGRVFAAVGSVFNTGQQSGNADGTGRNSSFIPTGNEQVIVPINIIVLLWTFYLRLKVWLRYWGLGCELIQRYYTSRENIVRLKSDLRFESIISFNINLPGSTFLSAFSFTHYGKENKNAEIGYESTTAAVVKKIFQESGVSDVVVNSRILNVFKKISVLQTAYRRASKVGGKSLAKLLNGWKTGQKYQFQIYYMKMRCRRWRHSAKSFEVK